MSALPLARRGVAPRAASLAVNAALAVALLAALAVAGAAAAGLTAHVEVSDSMRPALRVGDVVWLADIAARDAAAGDVVAFAHPDRRTTVLHRVQRVERAGGRLRFTTRGDANSGVERWSIAADGVLGLYAGLRVPAVGRATALPPSVALAAAVAVVLVLLRRIWR